MFKLGTWLNPIYFGDYPEIVKSVVAKRSLEEGRNCSRLIQFTEQEKTIITGTIDFVALNFYYGYISRKDETVHERISIRDDAGSSLIPTNDVCILQYTQIFFKYSFRSMT